MALVFLISVLYFAIKFKGLMRLPGDRRLMRFLSPTSVGDWIMLWCNGHYITINCI